MHVSESFDTDDDTLDIESNIPAPLHFNALSEVEIIQYLCCQDNAKTAICCLNTVEPR